MAKRLIKNCIKIAFVTSLCALVPVHMLLNHALCAVEEAIVTFQEAISNIDYLIEDGWELISRGTRLISDVRTPTAPTMEQDDEIEVPKWSAKGINSVVEYI